MAQLTFLAASSKAKLCKTYNQKGSKAYPNVAHFDSYAVPIAHSKTGIGELEKALKTAAQNGHCLLKGEAKQQIKKQRRVGLTDKNAPTDHIVIDIDGLALPNIDVPQEKLNARRIKELAEQTLTTIFPAYMHNISYVFGVSSGFGLKPTINIHYHFLLDDPVEPAALKDWLRSMNFDNELVRSQLTLNKTKTALKWTIDPATANNAQLIYIAPPEFVGVNSPIANDDWRIQSVKKVDHTLDLAPRLINLDPDIVKQETDKRINEICKDLGVKPRKTKYFSFKDGLTGEDRACVANPPRMRIRFEYERDGYAHFNINGGDSTAYWCFTDNPRVMYSFKGEDPFSFESADPGAYKDFCDQFAKKMEDNVKYMVVHDVERDNYAKVSYRQGDGTLLSLNYSKKDSCNDWLLANGEPVPDVIPPWTIEYNPRASTGVDMRSSIINTFVETDYMRANADIPEEITEDLTYGYGSRLHVVCPVIYQVLYHVLGNELPTFEHFINWLAYVFQTKTKAKTAWVLQGTQGTGKGILFEHILAPLFNHPQYGTQHPAALEKSMENFDDQFNSYIEHCLIMVVDEFRMGNSRNTNVENFFKNAITQEMQTLRLMRSNPISRRTYTNFIFTSNEADSVRIDSEDRRYNVGEFQRVKLKDVIPDLFERNIGKEIQAELNLFATFLIRFQWVERHVRNPILNTAKLKLREHSADAYNLLMQKFVEGDLSAYCEILESLPATDLEQLRFQSVRNTLLTWIAKANTGHECGVKKQQLREVFEYFANKYLPRKTWNTMLRKMGIEEQRITCDGVRDRFLVTKWTLEETYKEQLLRNNATQMDVERLKKIDLDISKYYDMANPQDTDEAADA